MGGLSSLPTAFSFGDGHGGNVMVSSASSPPSMLYVDYEVAGHYKPFLDLAKPIYQDGVFNILCADVLYGDLTQGAHCKDVSVKWREEAGSIHIDYHLNLKPLWKGLAIVKLEYLLKPMLEVLNRTASNQRELAEETLAYGLFSCAVLTRNYSTRADVFYLNLAVGVRLAAKMRSVFSDCFDWCSWPLRVPITEESILSATSGQPHFFDKRNNLAHAIDFVHTANVILLYDEAHQETFLLALAFLVKPGGVIWGRQVGIDEDESMSRYRRPEGEGVRFRVNQFHQLWFRATGWDTAQAQFEAMLTPYDEIRSPRADKRFSMHGSIRSPVGKTMCKIVYLN